MSGGDEVIMTMNTEIYSSSSEAETIQLGAGFAQRLVNGDVVAFYGELGAGKTEFIKGICEGMGVEEIVASPTYTIVNQYTGYGRRKEPVTIYHIDLYRIERQAELIEVGLADILADVDAIILIEWAGNAAAVLPPARYDVILTQLDDENFRRIEIDQRDAVAVGAPRKPAFSR